jgi:general secretion pathway protein C
MRPYPGSLIVLIFVFFGHLPGFQARFRPLTTPLNLPQVIQRWNIGTPEALVARAGDTLPFVVSLVLCVAIAWYAARLVWLLVPAPTPAPWSPPAPTEATAARPSGGDAAAYAAIVNAHLFGMPSASPDAGALNADNAPETQLALQLRGVVAAADDRFAHAIVADSAGLEKVYFLKDTLPGGAVLARIQPDRILLSRGGIVEALLLPKDATGNEPNRPAPRVAQSLARRQPTMAPSMQEVVTENASSFTDIVRPQPYMPNGEMRGYRLYPGRNREQFIALGLQPGDLVTEINGITLNNPSQAMELFRSLADTTQATVTIDRNGQAQTLTLDTKQISSAGGETQ